MSAHIPEGEVHPPKSHPPEERAEAWSSAAEAYDDFAEGATRHFAEDAVRLVRLRPGSRVLDVAAGTGVFTFAAARRGAEVLATDFSAGMIEAIGRKCAAQGLTTVKTAVMDGQALTVEDASFDVAASLFGLMFFPEHDRGLRELLRVLKPGGQAVVTTWAPPSRGEMFRLIGSAVMKALPNLPPPSKPPHWAALGDADDLRRRLLSVGFARAHVVSVTHVWTFESPEWLEQRLSSMSPASAGLFEAMNAAQRETFRRALIDDLRERQGEGPFAVTNEGLIAVGTKSSGT
ncbi:class I SAM-dependent methyltransferase [Hyalangium rubrum]|uniref:Methyltransferase domain-containing protein n=1 Tax=Hyalangium rubrum TaxID=3103134 RepID=A0ABU5H953_9BACT|nr:methyltransferase domain-containing protein [Hyalangium sp. s54d21]MDY7229378.1 methyltransferase domain-containing protein [Hyalangium sp. s54d21]